MSETDLSKYSQEEIKEAIARLERAKKNQKERYYKDLEKTREYYRKRYYEKHDENRKRALESYHRNKKLKRPQKVSV